MNAQDLPYTAEEEMIVDQFARNSRLVTECEKHPGNYYRTYSRPETVDRIDGLLNLGGDKMLALIKRNELQKKALILIALRRYGDRCAVCAAH